MEHGCSLWGSVTYIEEERTLSLGVSKDQHKQQNCFNSLLKGDNFLCLSK